MVTGKRAYPEKREISGLWRYDGSIFVNAMSWLRRVLVAGAILLVMIVVAAVVSFAVHQWFLLAFGGFGLALVWFIVARGLQLRAIQWEFARGYTTLRSYASQYRYQDPKSAMGDGDKGPVASKGAGAVVMIPGADGTRLPEAATRTRDGNQSDAMGPRDGAMSATRRAPSVLIVLLLALCLLMVGVARIGIFALQQPDAAWAVLPFSFGIVLVILGLLLGWQAAAAQQALRRVARSDSGDLYVVGSGPDLTRVITQTWPGAVVPARLILAVDDDGLRLWRSGSATGLIVAVAWSTVVSLKIGEAVVPMSSNAKRPVVEIIARTSIGDVLLPIFMRRPMFPGVSSRAGYTARVLGAIASRRPG